MPPRYFTARPSAVPVPDDLGAKVSHPLDVFALAGPRGDSSEWVVGFDDLGRLAAQPLTDAGLLPATRAQLAYHEVAGGTRRALRAVDLHLFELALIEQTATPGYDDPVYLYGTLVGPVTADGARARIEGQLTITRADLLEAAIAGHDHAFRYGAPGGAGLTRAFHFLLPADRPEELARGQGVVLAYPVLEADLHHTVPGNEYFFNQILYDLISAFWTDVASEAPPPKRRLDELPVPNRALVEQRLRNEGFVVEGDSARRRRSGILGSVLGSLVEDVRPLPAEGHSDDYVRLAAEVLHAVPGWPAERARALRACLNPASFVAHAPLPHAPWPAQAPPPAPPPPPRHRALPPAWMEDFIAAHTRPGGKPPRVTAPPEATPGWMSDFAPAAPGDSERSKKRESDEPSPRPAWMKDFDS